MPIMGNVRWRKPGRRGIIGIAYVDLSITAETTQPTIIGRPCRVCSSTIKFTKRKGTCVRCHKQWRRDHEKRPTYHYAKGVKSRLKISPENYYQILENQNWACAICKQQSERRLFIDHCHSTGKFRALLCPQCNSGLGCFKDDPIRLQAAIEYLANA